MNFRDRKLVITIRILLGLIFLFSGASGLLSGTSMQGVPAFMVPYVQSLWAMGIYQMIKTTELISGLMLITGFLPALAAIFLAPICVGIIIFNARIAPSFVIAGVVVSALDADLGYAYWDKYKALFKR